MGEADDGLVVAMANVLAVRVTRERPVHSKTVSSLLATMAAGDFDPLVLACAAGGTWAAFPDAREPPDDDVLEAAVASARALAVDGAKDEATVVLGSAALGLLATIRAAHTTAADLILAAGRARSVERHAVCSVFAAEALTRTDELTASQRVHSLLLVAVVDRDVVAGEQAMEGATLLEPDDPVRVLASQLGPTLATRERVSSTVLADAVERGDRRSAAAHFLDDVRELRSITDDDFLEGLETLLIALSAPQTDLGAARTGLALMWRQWRRRSRTGAAPPVALAGIEILLDLLILEPDETRADLLVEVVEALADSGVSSLPPSRAAPAAQIPALVEAQLSGEALTHATWPNLHHLMGVPVTDVVYVRSRRLMSNGGVQVLVLHVLPPDGLAVRNIVLDHPHVRTINRLAGTVADVKRLSQAAVDDVVEQFVTSTLRERLGDGTARSVLMIPDTVLWPIP